MSVKVIKVESSHGFPHSATLVISGDVGGNSQKNTITFTGDQFDCSEKSVSLEFYGAWELSSFFNLIELLSTKALQT